MKKLLICTSKVSESNAPNLGNLLWSLISVSSLICLSSCHWNVPKRPMVENTETPKICTEVFGDPPVTYEKLSRFSVSELLVLQRCGLAYSPHHQLSWYIANQNVYPVPELLKALSAKDDEYFKYHLILDFVALSKSEKHSREMYSDREQIRMGIVAAISKMENKEIQELSYRQLSILDAYWRT